VTLEAASEARNTATGATSAGCIVDHVFPLLLVHLSDGLIDLNARVSNDDVNLAELFVGKISRSV
jgi:hypothetical protein